jgi:hypothetical protein
MNVPICLFSGLTNYGTQTLSTIHVAYSHSAFCSEHILVFPRSSVPLASIARKCCHLPYEPPSAALNVSFKLLKSSYD